MSLKGFKAALADSVYDDANALGADMILTGIDDWEQYDEDGTFSSVKMDNGWLLSDHSEEISRYRYISNEEFAYAHYRLMVNREATTEYNVSPGWIDWIKDVDDWDSISAGFAVQILLYGEVIFS